MVILNVFTKKIAARDVKNYYVDETAHLMFFKRAKNTSQFSIFASQYEI